jgi:hypothetical protein
MSIFFITSWDSDPDVVPTELGFSIPEPVEPSREWEPPLLLGASEIVHSKCNLLHYHTIISILEVHDFGSPPSSNSDDGNNFSSGGSSSDKEYPGYDSGRVF